MRKEERERKLRQEMRRIYRVLKSHPIELELRWLFDDRELNGDYELRGTNGRIRIDPFKEMVSTLVHEVYHHLEVGLFPGVFPGARHKKIYALEKFVVRNASRRQLVNIFGYLVLHWRATMTDRRNGKPMPPCPLCGRRLRPLPGGEKAEEE